MLTYIFIFISKIIENALATLRLIVVANGKKGLGAILQLLISLIWVLVTGAVVTNLTKDFLKVIFFILGSLVGSYVGGILEEKLAMGHSLITYITKDSNNELYTILNLKQYNFIRVKGIKNNEDKDIYMITIPRKKRNHILHTIKEYDPNPTISSELIKLKTYF